MKVISLACLSVLLLSATVARAQAEAQPTSPQPTEQPAPLPNQIPAPPQAQNPVQAQQPTAGGQWIYTAQYGWVWMPYGSEYTSEPTTEGAQPYAYVYYPTFGWTWLAAPWIYGWGVWPYFGYYGPRYYSWYRYGWWGHHGPYGYAYNPGYRGYGYRGYGYRTYAYPPTYGRSWGRGVAPMYRANPARYRGGGIYRGGMGGGFRGGHGYGGGRSFGGGHGGRR